MNDREGIIKYQLQHSHCDLPTDIDISEINAWRGILFRLRLIGQSTEKYHGLAYGNISRRLSPNSRQFLISGTQTSHLDFLHPEHFAIVDSAVPSDNALTSHGPCKPSSEALTHAGVYLNAPGVQAVIHVHSPEIWRNTHILQLPLTGPDIPYGTRQMAEAVRQLFSSEATKTKAVFSMLGHEDGVVSFGTSLTAAANALLKQLANALAIEQSLKAS
ncbi:MAG: class II aldolase/adducin family protein [Methylomonas sp.]|nr:class II aldolase/adducin family protein [Methylomonas sp.]